MSNCIIYIRRIDSLEEQLKDNKQQLADALNREAQLEIIISDLCSSAGLERKDADVSGVNLAQMTIQNYRHDHEQLEESLAREKRLREALNRLADRVMEFEATTPTDYTGWQPELELAAAALAPAQSCPHCKGTGQQDCSASDHKCVHCGGSGYLEPEKPETCE